MPGDPELKKSIEAHRAEKDKYERVRNKLQAQGLNRMQELNDINEFINYCEKIVGIVDGEAGYHYVNVLSSRLKEDVKVMKEYRDYVHDANVSFVNVYALLEEKIGSLNSQIDSLKEEYNKDAGFWEKMW